MRVCAVHYDEAEDIETLTVTMTLGEARALHALAGALTGRGASRLGLTDDESLFDAIHAVFCRHYDSGCAPGEPEVNVATLNRSDES